jgi:catechol 2,3-dioxygenase-like lactoylglutathione lyase family enzyme
MKNEICLLFIGAILAGFAGREAIQTGLQTGVAATANHVGLSVKNLDAERNWYEKAFNMKEEQHFELPNPRVRTVLLRAPNGLGMELIERAGASREREYKDALDASLSWGYGHWAIAVDNLDRAFAKLTDAGAATVSAPGPAVQPGARFAYVKDPEGNLIELMQLPKH